MNKHFYFGYGMNTNIGGMKQRCPAAISMGSAALYDWDFRFAYHADVVPMLGTKTVGVLWELTDTCLASLDRLESYPVYYDRKLLPILHHGRTYQAWVYFMQPGSRTAPPGTSYWNCLLEGYTEHDVSRRQLHRAMNAAIRAEDDRLLTPVDPDGYYYDRYTYRSGRGNAVAADNTVPF